MKKIIVFISLTAFFFINALNIFSGFSNNSTDNVIVKKALADGDGANCWSQTSYEDGGKVLLCVTCVYEEDADGDGTHDGECGS